MVFYTTRLVRVWLFTLIPQPNCRKSITSWVHCEKLFNKPNLPVHPMEALRPIAKQPLQSFDFYERPFIPKYMTRILVIDNYDSFTYNLVSILREIPQTEVIVKRNDVVSEEELLSADAIILSPGPGIPSEAGDLMNLLALAADGFQCLGSAWVCRPSGSITVADFRILMQSTTALPR